MLRSINHVVKHWNVVGHCSFDSTNITGLAGDGCGSERGANYALFASVADQLCFSTFIRAPCITRSYEGVLEDPSLIHPAASTSSAVVVEHK